MDISDHDTQNAQISKKQDGLNHENNEQNLPGYHRNGFKASHAEEHMIFRLYIYIYIYIISYKTTTLFVIYLKMFVNV